MSFSCYFLYLYKNNCNKFNQLGKVIGDFIIYIVHKNMVKNKINNNQSTVFNSVPTYRYLMIKLMKMKL